MACGRDDIGFRRIILSLCGKTKSKGEQEQHQAQEGGNELPTCLTLFLPDLHNGYLLKTGASMSREMLYEHMALLYYGKKYILLLISNIVDDFIIYKLQK
ncbi:MAG: hypothetical protein MSC43_04185 [Clostridiales bacterium]|nr:hypothetical protein [Clostridiales bacterium]MDD7433028.1 hypothetical protein [Clostridiales bacterium]MDY3061743.1 hypothetical protein [Eubacteriales bacterium]